MFGGGAVFGGLLVISCFLLLILPRPCWVIVDVGEGIFVKVQ